MSEQPKAIGFYANEGSLSSGNNLEKSVTLKAAGTTNHAAVAHAIPINGMTLNKELKDKQMTGIGEGGDPMFSVRSSGQQHAVAFQQNTRNEVRMMNGDGQIAGALQAEAGMKQQNYLATGCMTPELPQRVRVHGAGGTSPTLSSEHGRGHGVPSVLAPMEAVQVQWASGGGQLENPTAQALRSGAEHNYQFLRQAMAVRRLTPRECERLQGFKDDHTLIPWRGKSPQDCPDGPRYKALGNSMAVPCMAWIGKRIATQHEGQVRYLSVCSGIEAASVAWEPLGWEPAAFAEVEKFPSAVLAHHWPQVPNLGDMTRHESWNLGAIDLLVGGTPCQSFSVAGLRKGLHDPRGGLMLTFLEIAQRQRPRWIVWENVPGVLSSHGGRDFGAFLGALGALGYG